MLDRRLYRPLLGSCLGLVVSACAPPVTAWHGATPETWPVLRGALAHQRELRATEPWAAGVRVALREPRTGRVIRGRGGLAVVPGHALRMILQGVAGMTMLDAWATPARWRVAVPPLGIVRRGDADDPADLPIGFLRWWFFTPLEGRLFAATFDGAVPVWLLRDGDAVVELRAGDCERGPRLLGERWKRGQAESVDECRAGPRPSVGDHVRYEDAGSGLQVELVLESVSTEPPVADAFVDPDTEQAP
jgi:hypothetical protein